ncbi:MAG: tyrosine recombinase XerC [Hyphomonas sp.]
MAKVNPKNERLKHAYAAYLQEAKRMTAASADDALAAIAAFEASTGAKDFSRFHIEQAKRFKRLQGEAINRRTGKPVSKATVQSRLMAVKAFFIWLAGQPGFRSRISYSDCDYFNPTANDARIASYRRDVAGPSLDQIRHVLRNLPHGTAPEKRDRALVAFIALTGVRDSAAVSLRLGHVDLAARRVFQDAREVNTKNRKTMVTAFFPVGEEIDAIVCDWVRYLREECLFSDDDPLFPKTHVGLNEIGEFAADGIAREPWSTAEPVRKLFRKAFEGAGLRYHHPHSFRHTLARIGQDLCKTPEQWRAWSQNLGHENIMTTWNAYGQLPEHRQQEILQNLASAAGGADGGAPTQDEIARVVSHLARKAG